MRKLIISYATAPYEQLKWGQMRNLTKIQPNFAKRIAGVLQIRDRNIFDGKLLTDNVLQLVGQKLKAHSIEYVSLLYKAVGRQIWEEEALLCNCNLWQHCKSKEVIFLRKPKNWVRVDRCLVVFRF